MVPFDGADHGGPVDLDVFKAPVACDNAGKIPEPFLRARMGAVQNMNITESLS